MGENSLIAPGNTRHISVINTKKAYVDHVIALIFFLKDIHIKGTYIPKKIRCNHAINKNLDSTTKFATAGMLPIIFRNAIKRMILKRMLLFVFPVTKALFNLNNTKNKNREAPKPIILIT